MGDSISKNDVKLAVKEVLNEQRLTQSQLRKMIQEEIENAKQKEEEEEKNSGAEKALDGIFKHLFKPNWMIKWYLLQFVLMCPVALGLRVTVMLTDTLGKQITTNGFDNFVALLLAFGIWLVTFIVVVASCFGEVKIYDKIKMSNPKFAKSIMIAIALYWFGTCWPDASAIEFLTNF